MPDGTVEGTFEIRGHRGRRHGGAREHGRIVCMTILGNRAWLAGIVDHAPNPGTVGEVIGFRVIDNGEGGAAIPDEEGRQLNIPSAGDYCSGQPEHATAPLEAGNIQVRGG
jgi:hypothetical protein